jgi:hypothetical protein
METLFTVSSIVLLVSTLICGLWLRYSGQKPEASAINFHVTFAVVTVIVTLATLLLFRK